MAGGEGARPSRVVYLRGLATSVTYDDVVAQMHASGVPLPVKISLQSRSPVGSALVEFATPDHARSAIAALNNTTPSRLCGPGRARPLSVQYSTHDAIAAPSAFLVASGGGGGGSRGGGGAAAPPMASHAPPVERRPRRDPEPAAAAAGGGGGGGGEHGRVLLVTLENLTRTISIDDVYRLLSVYGVVQRVSVVVKDGRHQVLVQFAAAADATDARAALDGAMLEGLCNLRVGIARTLQLTFATSNDRNHDYISAPLPPDARPGGELQALLRPHSAPPPPPPPRPAPRYVYGSTGAGGGGGYGPGGYGAGGYGAGAGFRSGDRGGRDDYPGGGPAGGRAGGRRVGGDFGGHADGGAPGGGSNVVVLTALPAEATAGEVFALCGLYGAVTAALLRPDRSDAVVVFDTADMAHSAVSLLNGCPWRDRIVGVAPAPASLADSALNPPPEAAANIATPATHTPPVYRSHNVAAPSRHVHVANVPPGTSSEQLRAHFAKFAPVVGAELFHNTAAKAVVTFATPADAVAALVAAHSCAMDGATTPLVLAFARHPPISQRAAS